ncbi:Ger(x)C family spore germination protein [Bacillus sp. FJAT-49711]|uniref:Ger(x)C family spore germination protein n=1 Tax=Bacillus sp. FJAT-49711 TaxID=2833585 RepID=UPI001BC97BD0|nr:Ger(x)C family spore germination protein [Bacillus sp. FJAT-49711]MBS4219775.1 Ger(x)C family spore germination protein [Bacillus sp. FJAT-49711]
MKIKMTFLLVLVMLLSGCGSQKELTDIAFVTALGIDKGEDGELIGTFQIVNPSNVAGGLQGGSAGEGAAVTVYTAAGKSVVEVSRHASTKASRLLYYSHTNLVVIGEEFAKEEGVTEILDALDRDVQFRTTTKLVIAHGTTAEDLLSITTPIDKIPSTKIIETLTFSQRRWGGNMAVSVRNMIENLTATGKEPIVPVYKINGDVKDGMQLENLHSTKPKTTLEADGMALFKGEKLIDFVPENKAIGIMWLLDKIEETNVSIRWKNKGIITYQVMRDKVKFSVNVDNGEPSFSILIKVKGDLGEVNVPINLNEKGVQDEIEKKVEKEIKEKIHLAIRLAQENQTDVLGFGEKVHRSHPDAWKTLRHDWNETHFPNVKVKVKVDASIIRPGLRSSPFMYQMDNK